MGPGSDGDCFCPRHACGHDLLLSPAMQQIFGGTFTSIGSWKQKTGRGLSTISPPTKVDLYALAHSIGNLRNTCDEDQLKVVMPTQVQYAYNPRPKTNQEWLARLQDACISTPGRSRIPDCADRS